jgi:5-methyltetrahydropteroyltriglutamate--homocysteine methyltransferase
MRRDAWQTVFSQAVEGFVDEYPIVERKNEDGTVSRIQMHTKAVRSKLRKIGRLAADDAAYLRQHAPGPFKLTLPSPAYIARCGFQEGVTNPDVYPDRAAMLANTTEIVRDEMVRLVQDGASYLQLDEGFALHLSPYANPDPKIAEAELMADIAAENRCHDAVRSDAVTVAVHVCRGSRVAWSQATGSYDWLAERLFDRLNVDRFVLEYDAAEIGGFEPLRFLPKGKVVALGLVSSKNPQLETRDALLRRIEDATRFCSIEQLALTSQCGFQSAAARDGAHMDYERQWQKIELIVQTAHEVWGG